MTLREYIKELNQLAKDHPEALEYKCITSIDDEGNGFNEVYYISSIGNYEDHEFKSVEGIKEQQQEDIEEGEEPSDWELNAICVN